MGISYNINPRIKRDCTIQSQLKCLLLREAIVDAVTCHFRTQASSPELLGVLETDNSQLGPFLDCPHLPASSKPSPTHPSTQPMYNTGHQEDLTGSPLHCRVSAVTLVPKFPKALGDEVLLQRYNSQTSPSCKSHFLDPLCISQTPPQSSTMSSPCGDLQSRVVFSRNQPAIPGAPDNVKALFPWSLSFKKIFF